MTLSEPRRAAETVVTATNRSAVAVLKCLVTVLVVSAALAVAGTFLHQAPVIGLASAWVPMTTVWPVVVPLVLAALAWVLWRGRRTVLGTVVGGISLVTSLGAVVIAVQMSSALNQAGADVNVLTATGFDGPSSASPDDQPVYLDDHGDELRVSVYRPDDASTRDPAPVLLHLHGGGWTTGSRNDRSADMRWFADQGWLVMSIDYSLSRGDRHLWDVVQPQIGCALSWIGENAAAYGGDPDRLSVTGDSAGGNLAINTAYLRAADALPAACPGTTPDVDAVAVTYPAVDPRSMYATSRTGSRYVTGYIGGTPTRFPQRYDAIDSSQHITPGAPPTFILTGTADHIVDVDSVDAFAARARATGVDTQLVRVPYADHIFDFLPGSIGQQANRQLTVAWLTDHGQGPRA